MLGNLQGQRIGTSGFMAPSSVPTLIGEVLPSREGEAQNVAALGIFSPMKYRTSYYGHSPMKNLIADDSFPYFGTQDTIQCEKKASQDIDETFDNMIITVFVNVSLGRISTLLDSAINSYRSEWGST